MRFLKCFAYILAEIAIIAATSYITICMTNTALYKEIAHNLSTNVIVHRQHIEKRSFKPCSKNLKEFYQGYQALYKKEMLESHDFADAMKLLEKDDILETQYKTAVYDLGNLYDKYIQEQGCCEGLCR